MDRYLTDSSSAATTPDMLPEEVLQTKLRIDFFRPILDVMKAGQYGTADLCVAEAQQLAALTQYGSTTSLPYKSGTADGT